MLTTTPGRAAIGPITVGGPGYLADVEIAGRRVADLDVLGHPQEARVHCHSLTDGLAGYIVRKTIRAGRVLSGGDGPLDPTGYDLAVIADPHLYASALTLCHEARRPEGDYAVVDTVYVCGCRSGR